MKISQVIAELTKTLAERGDLKVQVHVGKGVVTDVVSMGVHYEDPQFEKPYSVVLAP